MISPRRTKENGVVSPQTRFSTYETLQIASENNSRNQKDMKGSCSSLRQNVEASPSAVYRKQYEKQADVHDNLYLDVREVETNTNEISEQISPSGMTSKSNSYHDNGVNQSNETVDACEESESFGFSTNVWELQIDIDEVCLAVRHQLDVVAKTNSITSTEEYRSMLSYIIRVLQASSFTRDELS